MRIESYRLVIASEGPRLELLLASVGGAAALLPLTLDDIRRLGEAVSTAAGRLGDPSSN